MKMRATMILLIVISLFVVVSCQDDILMASCSKPGLQKFGKRVYDCSKNLQANDTKGKELAAAQTSCFEQVYQIPMKNTFDEELQFVCDNDTIRTEAKDDEVKTCVIEKVGLDTFIDFSNKSLVISCNYQAQLRKMVCNRTVRWARLRMKE